LRHLQSFRLALSVTALIAVPSLLTPATAQSPSSRTLVRAGHLLDVHTGKLLDAQTIVVTGDKITSIAPTASTPANSGDTVVDLGSLTVLPGLIDVHTHITGNAEFDPYKELAATDAKDAINGVVNARTTLMAGFTTIRNVEPTATPMSISVTPSTQARSPARTCWSADRPSASPAATATTTCSPSPITRSAKA
jgi:imidazolonepropionase-like amidohydrolase